jgi:hypothetical protein
VAIWNRKKDIDKAAPLLPQGSTATQFTQEQLTQIASQMYGSGVFEMLPRQQWVAGVPFGPNLPLTPSAINPVGEDGRPDPRRWEYPVAWNVFVTETRLVPWKVLRSAADQIDIIRRCIEVRKSKVAGLDWDITFTESASEMITRRFGGDHVRAMQKARDEFGDEIARLREFWQTPDRINGLSFKDWLGMALEEVDVLDALAIYPHPNFKGELHSLEILDGSTIKPLLDDRGMRPANPYPAFQQMLYGFPRGEFLASSDDPSLDGNFSADELIYLRKNNRTWTPYGYSPVERCLPLADIYIKRQQWLRAEFTDGVMPQMLLNPKDSFTATPEQIRAYENIINDDLAGQTEQRHRARILPPGLDFIDNSGSSEKFSSEFDEYLIKGITGHFNVLPSEIGYTPKSGLGGAGHQDGEASNAELIGTEPMVKWLEQQLSDICYRFLGMPRELEFRFMNHDGKDSETDARRRDIEVRGGQRTINEGRSESGLPLVDSEIADVPMLQTPSGLFFITAEGLKSAADYAPESNQPESNVAVQDTTSDQSQTGTPVDASQENQQQEIKAFLKWVKKGNTEREFEFKCVESLYADALNRAVKDNDLEMVKSLSDVVLGKA